MQRPQSAGRRPSMGRAERPLSAGPSRQGHSTSVRSRAFPGAQKITTQSQNRAAPKWSMGGRGGSDAHGRPGTPGPGSYSCDVSSVAHKKRQPAFGFGTAVRDTQARAKPTPGPGEYMGASEARPRSAGARFGTGPRDYRSMNKNGNPGPGSYVPNWDKVRHQTPAYSTTPRRDSSGRQDHGGSRGPSQYPSPGPGQYQAHLYESHQRTPAFGFGTAYRDHSPMNDYGPGPGAYNIDGAQVLHSGPAWSMRMRGMESNGSYGETPGPGDTAGVYTQFGY